MTYRLIHILFLLFLPTICFAQSKITVTDKILVNSFVGNGFQWGGYEMVPRWTHSPSLSEEDWQKSFERIDYMRPSIVRIMVSADPTYIKKDGRKLAYAPERAEDILFKMLDYCQENDIDIVFGEWGHRFLKNDRNNVDKNWLELCAKFLNELINEKKYSNIKYFTMVNEPNGDWSSTNMDYKLWTKLVKDFYALLKEYKLEDKVDIIAPDIAVWDAGNTNWFDFLKDDELKNIVKAQDIHIYPNEEEVRSGKLKEKVLKPYKQASDKNLDIIIGEIGIKYKKDSPLDIWNKKEIENDKFASPDSQMAVYKAFYAIDMADATIQAMQSAYAGVIYWNLDDAQYNYTQNSRIIKLKKWGYWNILGKEKFNNPKDEEIRAWFYTTSLLCRYFPRGTQIFETQISDNTEGLRAIAGTKDGKNTFVIVNNSENDYDIELVANINDTSDFKKYIFVDKGEDFEGKRDENAFPEALEKNININKNIKMPKKSFILYTNME